jgi:geranylgeranyl pyrophosphate synthase
MPGEDGSGPRGESLAAWAERWTAEVERSLKRLMEEQGRKSGPESGRLIGAMWGSLLSGGKRLRPLMALAAARALGRPEERAMPAALACELMHTYSLIHDDLPALDNDPLRRGLPSCHVAYGEAAAILCGDALQSLAFAVLSERGAAEPADALRAVNILARAAGPTGMAGGQMEDLEFERGSPSRAQRDAMASKKTGELMGAALGAAAALCGADREAAALFREAGVLAGQAFQIQDDVLNSEGDPDRLGKPAGTDRARGKASVLNYVSPEMARLEARKLAEAAARLLEPRGPAAEILRGLIMSLAAREA